MSYWKTGIALAAAVGAFLLVKVAPTALGFVGGKLGVESLMASKPSAERIEAELQAQGYKLFLVIKEEMPTEYSGMLASIQEIIATQSGNGARDATKMVAAIRRKHAGLLRQAPDEMIHHTISMQLQTLELVAAKETPAVCAQYTIRGPLVLATPDRQYLMSFDAAGASLFRAYGAAIRSPEPAGEATDQDWSEVANLYLATGGTEAELKALERMDPNDPQLCAATIKFYQSVLRTPPPSGPRIRAFLVYNMAME